jgi:phage regulator Rha-like protein
MVSDSYRPLRAVMAALMIGGQSTPGASESARTRQICGLHVAVVAEHDVGMSKKAETATAANVASQIHVVRGQRVLLDSDLAALYGVTTKAFNQAVRRNVERFPADFLLQLTESETDSLRSQIVTLKTGRGQHRKYMPMAFTEHGAIMAAMILNSPRAVEMSVYVVRAFVKLREVLASHAELARKLETLEKSVASLDANTRRQFEEVYGAILSLMGPAAVEQ